MLTLSYSREVVARILQIIACSYPKTFLMSFYFFLCLVTEMLPVEKENEYYRTQTFIKCTKEESAASVAPICGPPTDFDNERAAQIQEKLARSFL